MIRNKVGEYFGVPMGEVKTPIYMANMNEAGKITARSLLDLMTIIIEDIDELQNKEETVSILDWKNDKNSKELVDPMLTSIQKEVSETIGSSLDKPEKPKK